jgi:hypothetical protein
MVNPGEMLEMDTACSSSVVVAAAAAGALPNCPPVPLEPQLDSAPEIGVPATAAHEHSWCLPALHVPGQACR